MDPSMQGIDPVADGPPACRRIPGLTAATEIGRGGFGTVYRARQTAYNRTVAVKVISARVDDDDTRMRFEREVKAMGALSDHPHIVPIYEANLTPDRHPYLVMEYMTGGTLADRLRNGPLDVAAAVSMALDVASALDTAHAAGVLHRDVKPENLMYSSFGEVKLGDFGISWIRGVQYTQAGRLHLSLAHVAPEVLTGEPSSVLGDIYSLGSVLYAALSGEDAFSADGTVPLSITATRMAVMPVPDLRPWGVPDAVCRVVERAMAKFPADRYATMREFRQDLGALVLKDIPMGAAEPQTPRSLGRRRTVGICAGLGVAVALAAAWGWHALTTHSDAVTTGSTGAPPGFTLQLPQGWSQVPLTIHTNGVTTVYQAQSGGSSLFVGESAAAFSTVPEAGAWLESQDSAFSAESPMTDVSVGGWAGGAVEHLVTVSGNQTLAQVDVVIPYKAHTYWIIFDTPSGQPQLPALETLLQSWRWS